VKEVYLVIHLRHGNRFLGCAVYDNELSAKIDSNHLNEESENFDSYVMIKRKVREVSENPAPQPVQPEDPEVSS